jgi:predicted ABC-type ATPase
MEKRPEFTVIAGPNGAGKSRLCPFYIHTKSFDGDLLALNLRKEHPEWEERWISGTVAGELERQKNRALESHSDFAFETNFSNDLILNLIREFKEAGYKISLYYFGVINIEECATRVMQRKMFGGHDVPNEVIKYNFTEGIKRAQENLQLFDAITFIDGNSDFGEMVALYIKKSNKHEIMNETYEWFNRYFREEFEKLRKNTISPE